VSILYNNNYARSPRQSVWLSSSLLLSRCRLAKEYVHLILQVLVRLQYNASPWFLSSIAINHMHMHRNNLVDQACKFRTYVHSNCHFLDAHSKSSLYILLQGVRFPFKQDVPRIHKGRPCHQTPYLSNTKCYTTATIKMVNHNREIRSIVLLVLFSGSTNH
jgi:hypothetical protein